jgi:hypothetical protein
MKDQLIQPLGHNDAATTMIYTHVLNCGGKGVGSPAEAPMTGAIRFYTEENLGSRV